LTLLRLLLLLSVFVLHDSLSVCLSVCYSCILILYFVYDFNNNNNRLGFIKQADSLIVVELAIE